MGKATIYSPVFYDQLSREAPSSAAAVVPMVMGILNPRSVVDFGCGNAAWLAAFVRAGVTDYLGIDGEHTPRDRLLIAPDRFRAADLSAPIELDRAFDLAVSLEVAEHLPSASADGFVASLTHAAPVVLFSAAIPGQGGTGHVNEQWQEYWRAKFATADFVATDPIRPRIWGRPEIAAYYQQNIVVYVARAHMQNFPALAPLAARHSVNLAHPLLFRNPDPTLGEIARMLPRVIRNSARFHLRRFFGRRNPAKEPPTPRASGR